MTGTVTPVETTATAELTAHDRCDRCGAQARVRVQFASGELLFCGHHAKEYDEALRKKALAVVEPVGVDA